MIFFNNEIEYYDLFSRSVILIMVIYVAIIFPATNVIKKIRITKNIKKIINSEPEIRIISIENFNDNFDYYSYFKETFDNHPNFFFLDDSKYNVSSVTDEEDISLKKKWIANKSRWTFTLLIFNLINKINMLIKIHKQVSKWSLKNHVQKHSYLNHKYNIFLNKVQGINFQKLLKYGNGKRNLNKIIIFVNDSVHFKNEMLLDQEYNRLNLNEIEYSIYKMWFNRFMKSIPQITDVIYIDDNFECKEKNIYSKSMDKLLVKNSKKLNILKFNFFLKNDKINKQKHEITKIVSDFIYLTNPKI